MQDRLESLSTLMFMLSIHEKLETLNISMFMASYQSTFNNHYYAFIVVKISCFIKFMFMKIL